jgi:hypothetical protein
MRGTLRPSEVVLLHDIRSRWSLLAIAIHGMMAAERRPPITIRPTAAPADPSRAAAFVFVHGLGDEAEGVESMYSSPPRLE